MYLKESMYVPKILKICMKICNMYDKLKMRKIWETMFEFLQSCLDQMSVYEVLV